MIDSTGIWRAKAVIAVLCLGFLIFLWPPMMWMRMLQEGRAITGFADYALWLWPLNSGLTVMIPFYLLHLHPGSSKSFLPLMVGILQLAVSIPVLVLLCILSAISGEHGIVFLALFLAFTYLMYRTQRTILVKFREHGVLWKDTVLEKAYVFAFFGIPAALIYFIRFVNVEWFGTFP